MTESSVPVSLAERALARLRKLATGNGLEPAAITILETQEQNFAIAATMEVSPLSETESATYPGPIRGKGHKAVASAAELQQAVALHKKQFRENPDWVEATIKELESDENHGWGLENAKVTLPEKSGSYAASETCGNCGGRQLITCTQCQGRGTVICTQCQGQGREQCYYCGGRGEDPQQPGQKCHTCQGTRYAPCRFCQTHGYLTCPTCNGKRGTPCPACNATGKITQQVTVTCGAETHFKLNATGLPSGLRRGLERIGIAKLGKGHADITATPVPEPDEDSAPPKEGAPIPILNYQAVIPYAELRMGFGDKKAIVSVVGKRGVMSGVPPFLDKSLQKWRDSLKQAASGKITLDPALEARALREILALAVAGKDRVEDVRRLYPFGFSTEAINAILNDMRLALNRTTLKTRALIAILCGTGGAILFYILFMTGVELLITGRMNRWLGMVVDFALLAGVLAASWAILNFSTRLVLKRRFPQLTLALTQKIGKTGLSMLAGICLSFILFLALAPVRPLWLALLLR